MTMGKTHGVWWAWPALQAAAVALLLLAATRLLRNLYQLDAVGAKYLAGWFFFTALAWLAASLALGQNASSGSRPSWLPALAAVTGFAGLALLTVAWTLLGMMLLAVSGLFYAVALWSGVWRLRGREA